MRFSPSLLVSAALVGVLLAHGCATVSSSVMVPQDVRIERALGGSVRIEATGTPRRAYIARPLVQDDALAGAVREAVTVAGLFDEVVEGSARADRVLSVALEDLREPELGLDQTCRATMRWRLLTGDGRSVLWEEAITTDLTVHSFEQVDAEERARMAIEGALRRNIQRGLMSLSREG